MERVRSFGGILLLYGPCPQGNQVQNFDSMADMPHVVTGEFSIETDAELGAVISGMYDYDEGFWAHKYIVRNLTKDSMEWIASDDPSFVQEFVRVSEIPTSIKQ